MTTITSAATRSTESPTSSRAAPARVRFERRTGVHGCVIRARHFVEVAVFADRLVVRAIDQKQRVFDELVLSPRDRTAMRGPAVSGS